MLSSVSTLSALQHAREFSWAGLTTTILQIPLRAAGPAKRAIQCLVGRLIGTVFVGIEEELMPCADGRSGRVVPLAGTVRSSPNSRVAPRSHLSPQATASPHGAIASTNAAFSDTRRPASCFRLAGIRRRGGAVNRKGWETVANWAYGGDGNPCMLFLLRKSGPALRLVE